MMAKNIYDPIEVDSDYFPRHEAEENELHAKIRALPKAVSDILFDIETPDLIEKICQSYQLNEKQSEDLSRLIRQILVAEIYLGNIVQEITSRLMVGQDIAKEVANRLITEVFALALEEIKSVHVEKFEGRKEEKPALPPMSEPRPEDKVNPNNVLNLRDKT